METKGYQIILASASPRRQAFFKELGIPHKIQVIPVQENYPNELKGAEIAMHIAKQKSIPFESLIQPQQLVITADTIVWNQGCYLGKPKSKEEAIKMLKALSNSTHQVTTAVGFLTVKGFELLVETSEVTFRKLTKTEINHYVESGSPMDKAGAYGIQDPFGEQVILSINGSFSNIVGLPLAQVVIKIQDIVNKG
ncbi:MAG: Maf family nucleotide pyrophosphatase [Flavobacteriaceae bacterium]